MPLPIRLFTLDGKTELARVTLQEAGGRKGPNVWWFGKATFRHRGTDWEVTVNVRRIGGRLSPASAGGGQHSESRESETRGDDVITARLVTREGEELASVELEELGPRIGPATGHRGKASYTHDGQEWVVRVTVSKAPPKGPRKRARQWEG